MPRPLTILAERERWLAAMKPPGLLTVPPPKAARRGEDDLIARLRAEGNAVHAVHRLDKETSGVVLCARDREAREALMELFRRKAVKKTYRAFVQGRLKRAQGTLNFPIEDLGRTARVSGRGQGAETRYEVERRFAGCDLVRAEPLTGRHNQIRLHFAHLGHPLVGERKFARGSEASVRHKRCALHASELAFVDPFGGGEVSIEAPLPLDLRNLLERLQKGERRG